MVAKNSDWLAPPIPIKQQFLKQTFTPTLSRITIRFPLGRDDRGEGHGKICMSSNKSIRGNAVVVGVVVAALMTSVLSEEWR